MSMKMAQRLARLSYETCTKLVRKGDKLLSQFCLWFRGDWLIAEGIEIVFSLNKYIYFFFRIVRHQKT
jgi:hypothetical protein